MPSSQLGKFNFPVVLTMNTIVLVNVSYLLVLCSEDEGITLFRNVLKHFSHYMTALHAGFPTVE
jgi:hypothetical protein